MKAPPPGALRGVGRVGYTGCIISSRYVQTVLLIHLLSHRLEICAMVTFVVPTIEEQVIMDHFMNHDIPEGFFIKFKIVREELPFALICLSFSPVVFEPSQNTKGMEKAIFGSWQLVVEVLPVALPKHVGHRVIICYHAIYFLAI